MHGGLVNRADWHRSVCVFHLSFKLFLLPLHRSLSPPALPKDAVISSSAPRLHYSAAALSLLKDESSSNKDVAGRAAAFVCLRLTCMCPPLTSTVGGSRSDPEAQLRPADWKPPCSHWLHTFSRMFNNPGRNVDFCSLQRGKGYD